MQSPFFMTADVNICWFRRDLRLNDNAALYHALQGQFPVLPLFIFDRNILDRLENKTDRRVEFIYQALELMQEAFQAMNIPFEVHYDTPEQVFSDLLKKYNLKQVFCNEDYEPYARERDASVAALVQKAGVSFHSYKDQVIFDKYEIMKDDGTPYTIFTPYSNKWKSRFEAFYTKPYPVKKYFENFFRKTPLKIPTLQKLGFKASGKSFPSAVVSNALIERYSKQRNFPGLDATSHIGIHLRFGTVSIRQLAEQAAALSDMFLNELIWRDFYHMILWHFPHVGRGKSFKPAFDQIEWKNNETDFERWCRGQTGYPIVDAGMRQLNETGFMHNRVRMIVASFLSRHLLIDWRWGEAYFAEKLLDFDLASNNGGWQWAAGTGCDAAPYFRIFNPSLQAAKFDKDHQYIRRWVPEFDQIGYPEPMVEHAFARNRAIKAYEKAVKQ